MIFQLPFTGPFLLLYDICIKFSAWDFQNKNKINITVEQISQLNFFSRPPVWVFSCWHLSLIDLKVYFKMMMEWIYKSCASFWILFLPCGKIGSCKAFHLYGFVCGYPNWTSAENTKGKIKNVNHFNKFYDNILKKITFPQSKHSKGFSPVWSIMWISSSLL